MRSRKVFLGLILIIAVFLLGIGYAAISNVTLDIAGSASASASDANFKVKFDSSVTPVTSNATASITGDKTASIAVTGLTTKGDKATATYTVVNESTDLGASLTANVTKNTNSTFFAVTHEFAKTTIEAGEKTTITVTVELIKTPATDQSGQVAVQLTASPLQAGESGDSGNSGSGTGTGGETATLALITNNDIGDYIDLGNNIVGTESTADDWRVLYVKGNKVYAILADYLPNSTGYAESAGLDTEGTYNVYSNTDRNKLLRGLTTSSYWSGLANGIAGATVTGSPTADLLMNSYNTKNGTNIEYTDYSDSYFMLDATTADFNLYVPHYSTGGGYDGCYSYVLATASSMLPLARGEVDTASDYACWFVYHDGRMITLDVSIYSSGIRPVVSLPSSTECSYANGIWTIE